MATSICSSLYWKLLHHQQQPVINRHSSHCQVAEKKPPISRLVALNRRNVILFSLLGSFTVDSGVSAAAESDAIVYERNNFSLTIPKDWSQAEGKSGARKVFAFHPNEGTAANVNVIISDLGAEFTGVGSFGSVDTFAANMLGSMDRPGVKVRLIDAVSRNRLYYVEYTVDAPQQPQRHLFSVVGVGATTDSFFNKLFTVTGQYLEEDSSKYKDVLQQMIQSFHLVTS